MNSAVKALIWFAVFIGLILTLENIESVFGWLPDISGAKVSTQQSHSKTSTSSQKANTITEDTEKEPQRTTDEPVRNENQATEQYATITANGKLRITATYFYNEYKGNMPDEAVILAFPDKEELKQTEVPARVFDLAIFRSKYEKFMTDLGGGYAVTGGDGKADMRLAPGKYEVWVLMDKMPYIQGQFTERLLRCRFSEEFAKSHSTLGRVKFVNAEVYPNDTTELSVNLK